MKGKRILFTGAGSGFGELAAIGLAKQGHDVIAGVQIPCVSRLIARKLDFVDTCAVGPVHAAPGLLGGLAGGLWAPMFPSGFHG